MNADKKTTAKTRRARKRNAAGGFSFKSTFIAVHVLLILCFLLPGLSGCGYSHSGEGSSSSGYEWRSLYREDVRTVAVPIFANKTFRRGVEFQLTQAIVVQLEAKSPYKVVARERADTVLEGE